MKRLSTLQLFPGMIVAENVLSYDHQLILSRGTVLTDQAITKLDLYGILTIYVENMPPGKYNDAAEASYSRIKDASALHPSSKNTLLDADSLRDMINNVAGRNLTVDAEALIRSCLSMIADGKGQLSVMHMLQNMKEYDNSTFYHCMNVALLSHVFATWLGWGREDIKMATACGMLHDIGKLTVPYIIISKPGKLSAEEYTQVKKHPISGYQLLLAQNVDDHIRYAALMHHERWDGTGYPMHLVGSQIDRFARLVAIADVYDAMTAARVYRGPLCPFRVIEIFEEEGFQKYDMEYLLVFLENVVKTYLQSHCRLSDGREGVIVLVNKAKLSRPVVQCGREYINLAETPELSITEIL